MKHLYVRPWFAVVRGIVFCTAAVQAFACESSVTNVLRVPPHNAFIRGFWRSLNEPPYAVSGNPLNGGAINACVSENRHGNCLAVWQQLIGGPDGSYNVFAAYFDACSNSWSQRTNLSSKTTPFGASDAEDPQVKFDDCGNGFAYWRQATTLFLKNGAHQKDVPDNQPVYNIFASWYDGTTGVWTTPVNISLNQSANALAPIMAFAGGNNGVAVWQEEPATESLTPDVVGTACNDVIIEGIVTLMYSSTCGDVMLTNSAQVADFTFYGIVKVNGGQQNLYFEAKAPFTLTNECEGAFEDCTAVDGYTYATFDTTIVENVAVSGEPVTSVIVSIALEGTVALDLEGAVKVAPQDFFMASDCPVFDGYVDALGSANGCTFVTTLTELAITTSIGGCPEGCPEDDSDLVIGVKATPGPLKVTLVAADYNPATGQLGTPQVIAYPLALPDELQGRGVKTFVVIDGFGNITVVWCAGREGSSSAAQMPNFLSMLRSRSDGGDGGVNDIFVAIRPGGSPAWNGPVDLTLSSRFDSNNPTIATNACGACVIAWQTLNDAGINDIYVLDLIMGTMPTGSGILVSNGTSDAINPQAVVSCPGKVTLIWQQAFGNDYRVVSCSFNADPTTRGPVIDFSGSGNVITQTPARIATLDSQGNAICVWVSQTGPSPDDSAIMASTHNAANDSWLKPVTISGTPASAQNPAISSDGIGGAMALWQAISGYGVDAIYGRRYVRSQSEVPFATNELILLESHELGAPVNAVAWLCKECGCSCGPLAVAVGDTTCDADVRVYQLMGEQLMFLAKASRADRSRAASWCCINGTPYLAVGGTADETGNEVAIFTLARSGATFTLKPVACWKQGAPVNCISWLCTCYSSDCAQNLLAIGSDTPRGCGPELQLVSFDPRASQNKISKVAQFSHGAPIYSIDWCTDCRYAQQTPLLAIGGTMAAAPCGPGSDVNVRVLAFNCSGLAPVAWTHDASETVMAVKWCCTESSADPVLAVGGSPAMADSALYSGARLYCVLADTNRMILKGNALAGDRTCTTNAIDTFPGDCLACPQHALLCANSCLPLTLAFTCTANEDGHGCPADIVVYTKRKASNAMTCTFSLDPLFGTAVSSSVRSLAWCRTEGAPFAYLLAGFAAPQRPVDVFDGSHDENTKRTGITLYKARIAPCSRSV